jgi:hypothetical protein
MYYATMTSLTPTHWILHIAKIKMLPLASNGLTWYLLATLNEKTYNTFTLNRYWLAHRYQQWWYSCRQAKTNRKDDYFCLQSIGALLCSSEHKNSNASFRCEPACLCVCVGLPAPQLQDEGMGGGGSNGAHQGRSGLQARPAADTQPGQSVHTLTLPTGRWLKAPPWCNGNANI